MPPIELDFHDNHHLPVEKGTPYPWKKRIYISNSDTENGASLEEIAFEESVADIGDISLENVKRILLGQHDEIDDIRLKSLCVERKSFRGRIGHGELLALAQEANMFHGDLPSDLPHERKKEVLFLSPEDEAKLPDFREKARNRRIERLSIKAQERATRCLEEAKAHAARRSESPKRTDQAAPQHTPQPPSQQSPERLSMTRREVFKGVIGSTVLAAIVFATGALIQRSLQKPPRPGLKPKPTKKPDTPETLEIPREKTYFELVLEKSLPQFLEGTRTYRDNILDPYAVSEYFLNSRFRYTGLEETVTYEGQQQRAHRFTVIGEKSGYLGRKGKGKELYKTTDAAQAVNTILKFQLLSDYVIQRWLAWAYKKAYGVTLDPERIQVVRKRKSLEVKVILYNPPQDFKKEVAMEVAMPMTEVSPTQPGGRMSKKKEPQSLLDNQNRLLLPSGISPQHDLLVPIRLLHPDPTFTLQMNGYGKWDDLNAGYLAASIIKFEKRLQATKGKGFTQATAYGRTFPVERMEPLVERDNRLIKTLIKWLLQNIPQGDHQARVLALTRFVQNLPYKWENDTDVDRPAIITLFNGGGDCNNVTLLWTELMLAAGYDAAILQSDMRKEDLMIHARGGIPGKYFPNLPGWGSHQKGEPPEWWVPIELAGDTSWQPGKPEMGPNKDEMVFLVEVLRAHE